MSDIAIEKELSVSLKVKPEDAFKPRLDFQPPPFCEIADGPDYTNSIVSVEVHSGLRIKGKLIRFDVNAERLSVLERSKKSPTVFEFQNIKFLRLEKPYQITMGANPNDEKSLQFQSENEARSFQVYFKDRTELLGKTCGSRVDKNGVHFYEQLKKGRKWQYCTHLFVSKAAIENYVIGEKIGNVLVKENAISQGVLDEVLEAQQSDRSRMIGEYLLKNNAVDTQGLEKALARQQQTPNVRLGDILISENLISQGQLEDALKAQKQSRKKSVGEILVDRGVIHRYQIQQCLAKKTGIPFVDLKKFSIDPEVIKLIDADTAYSHKIVPLYVFDKKLVVAIENPTDSLMIDSLRFDLKKHIEPVMATSDDINWALQFHYSADDITKAPRNIEKEGAGQVEDYDKNIFTDFELSNASSASATRIVDKIIEDAHRQKVSDIHIEPGHGDQSVTVRFRKGGSLAVYYKFPGNYRQEFVSRLKTMARLDITNKRNLQEGKVVYRNFGPLDIELRVTTMPIAGGVEDVVISIVNSARCMSLNALGLSTRNLSQVLDTVSKQQGMFLVCGPSGSGKSTTLHSILNHLNQKDRKIFTAEDSIEVVQPGLRQVEVDVKAGVTYTAAIDSFLKADPDLIMLSELPDEETLKKASVAALSGHLVLSSLHTTSVAESVARLMDMGMDPFNLADSLLGILSQRLVRTLCGSCKTPYRPERHELEALAIEYCRDKPEASDNAVPDHTELIKQIKSWEVAFTSGEGFTLYKAPGCKDCMDTGYRGHTGVYELLLSSPGIKRLIINSSSAEKIQLESQISGMLTHKQDGIEKLLMGLTDFPEIRIL